MRTLILLAAMTFFIPVANANTFSFDNRKALAANNPAPWGAVGVLYRPGNKYCTAYLVGPELLMTTAACVADQKNELIEGTYTFKPGARARKSKYSAKATRIWWGDLNDSGNDWAILRLDWKVGDKVGWFGVADYQLNDLLNLEKHYTLYMVGYSQDAYDGDHPVWQKDCGPKNLLGKTVLHDCSAQNGAAGSPIFMFKEVNGTQTTVVIAMHSGERRNGSKKSLKGVAYSPEVANAAVPSAAFIQTVRQLRED